MGRRSGLIRSCWHSGRARPPLRRTAARAPLAWSSTALASRPLPRHAWRRNRPASAARWSPRPSCPSDRQQPGRIGGFENVVQVALSGHSTGTSGAGLGPTLSAGNRAAISFSERPGVVPECPSKMLCNPKPTSAVGCASNGTLRPIRHDGGPCYSVRVARHALLP